MPFKSEEQRRYLWANEPEIARDWTDTYGSKIQKAYGGRIGYYSGGQSIPSEYTVEDARKTAMQDKLGGITDIMKKADLYRQGDIGQMYMANGGMISMQGGVKNYLGEQPMVSAPKYWQSAPDHEMTELAYITPRERDVLVNMDMYGTMQGSPNKGPSGIMSLNGWGDANEGMADKSFGGNERGGGPNPHTDSGTSPTVNTMPDVVDQKYSGDGFFSGYRNLDDRGQPKMGLAYLGDRLKSVVPGVMGAFMGNPWVGTGFKALKSFAQPDQTLTGWWGDRQNWSGDKKANINLSNYQRNPKEYEYIERVNPDYYNDLDNEEMLSEEMLALDNSNQNLKGIDQHIAFLEPLSIMSLVKSGITPKGVGKVLLQKKIKDEGLEKIKEMKKQEMIG